MNGVNGLISYENPAIKYLRAHEILATFDQDQVPSSNGLVLVGCSDKNRFHDLFLHISTACGDKIHTFSWHGAALRLTRESPTNRAGRVFARLVLKEIEDAIEIAETTTIVLTAHLPCSKARLANMHWTDVLTNLWEAKRYVKKTLGHKATIKVVTLLHIHFYKPRTKEECKRTYFFSSHRWMVVSKHVRMLDDAPMS
jgi:hypothetical protein